MAKKGDRNTRFFHKMANSHRRRNAINKLIEDNDIQKRVVDAFKRLLSDMGDGALLSLTSLQRY